MRASRVNVTGSKPRNTIAQKMALLCAVAACLSGVEAGTNPYHKAMLNDLVAATGAAASPLYALWSSYGPDPCEAGWAYVACDSKKNIIGLDLPAAVLSAPLTGQLPVSLFDSHSDLRKLNFADNKFSGVIPSKADNRRWELLNLQNNLLNGPVPDDLRATDDGAIIICGNNFPAPMYPGCAATQTATASRTPTATRSVSLSGTASRTPSKTRSLSNSASLTATASRTATRSRTPSHSESPSRSPTISFSASRTPTISESASRTPTISQSASRTPTISETASRTPTISLTPSSTPTISLTASRTPTPSVTPSTICAAVCALGCDATPIGHAYSSMLCTGPKETRCKAGMGYVPVGNRGCAVATFVEAKVSFCVKMDKTLTLAQVVASLSSGDYDAARDFYLDELKKGNVNTDNFASVVIVAPATAEEDCHMPEDNRRLGESNLKSFKIVFTITLKTDAVTAQKAYHGVFNVQYYEINLRIADAKTTLLGATGIKGVHPLCDATCATCLDTSASTCVTCPSSRRFWRNNQFPFGRCIPGSDGNEENPQSIPI